MPNLDRLSRSLAGGAPPATSAQRAVSAGGAPPAASPSLQRPVEPVPAATPPAELANPTPAPSRAIQAPIVAPPVDHAYQPYEPRLLTALGRTQPIAAWAAEIGLPRATLRYRLNHGWAPEEILGLVPRPRDRGAEQAASAARHARVLLIEEVPDPEDPARLVTRVVPRAEAAARLGIKPLSLTHRLRRYRLTEGVALLPLQALSTRP